MPKSAIFLCILPHSVKFDVLDKVNIKLSPMVPRNLPEPTADLTRKMNGKFLEILNEVSSYEDV